MTKEEENPDLFPDDRGGTNRRTRPTGGVFQDVQPQAFRKISSASTTWSTTLFVQLGATTERIMSGTAFIVAGRQWNATRQDEDYF